MAFLQPEIEQGEWYEVETDNGTEYIPADVLRKADRLTIGAHVTMDDPAWDAVADLIQPYCEATPQEVKRKSGWGARLSAPGYLDCTPWTVFETEQEALDFLADETEDDASDV